MVFTIRKALFFICLPFILQIFISQKVTAQKPVFLVEAGVGSSIYFGDLSKKGDKLSSIFTVSAIRKLGDRSNLKLNVSFGSITGSNRSFSVEGFFPNTFFKTNLFIVEPSFQFSFFQKDGLSIFLSQGIGFLTFDPKDDNSNSLADNSTTRADGETYRNLSIAFPTGLGVQKVLKSGFGFGFSLKLYNSLTDYLDNISELGDSKNKDNFLSTSFSLLIPLKFGR